MTGSGVPEVFPTEDVASAGGELEVVMGHPGLESPGDVSLSEAMSTTHFALCQAQDVLQWERITVEEEWQRFLEWCSLLKEQTTSEKEKAVVKREQLDEMELLLNQERVAIGLLDAKAQKLMVGAKELYVMAEACADTTIKQEEGLNTSTIAIDQRERVVAEREQELQEKEEEVIDTLECGRSELSSHEASLNTCEVTLEVE
jgi:hypothetical protein